MEQVMHHIQLPDQLYENVQRRAAESGFASVDDYVADVLTGDLQSDTPNLDYFFTPARVAKIQAADAQIDAGNCYSSTQADAELAKRREQWVRRNSEQ
jgi:hypothetical protein